MLTQRFGRKLKLPSTAAIKHQLLMLMLEDEIRAVPQHEVFTAGSSPALGKLRRMMVSRLPRSEQTSGLTAGAG